ncbi:hypothetical protein [Mageeibacillus indolicus]|nr:hypothetical protein [Mageeibacillus indolicus]
MRKWGGIFSLKTYTSGHFSGCEGQFKPLNGMLLLILTNSGVKKSEILGD